MEESKLPTSRAEAKALQSVRYYTGKPCLRGHIAERFTSTGQCYTCITDHAAAWHKSNPEKVAAGQRAWRDKQPKRPPKPSVSKSKRELGRLYSLRKRGFLNANPDVQCVPIDSKVRWSIYYEANKSAISAKQKDYRERRREHLREAFADWYSKNRVSQIEKAVMRRKKVIDATPSWLSQEHRKQISEIYFSCVHLSNETGIEHHVDHIVPIAGRRVCGLHVPWNLQVIPASENLSKSNKFSDA